MNKKEIAIVILAVIAVSIFVALTESINDAQAFQTVITAALFFITAIYVNRTADIAQATEKQAKASVKMAEEMKEQRFTTSQPLILPDFSQARFPDPGEIRFFNLGNGPALNIEVKVVDSTPDVVKKVWLARTGSYGAVLTVPVKNYSVLRARENVVCRPELAERHPGNTGTVFATYSDIYQREFLAGFGYRCESYNQGTILYPTEPVYPIMRPR